MRLDHLLSTEFFGAVCAGFSASFCFLFVCLGLADAEGFAWAWYEHVFGFPSRFVRRGFPPFEAGSAFFAFLVFCGGFAV